MIRFSVALDGPPCVSSQGVSKSLTDQIVIKIQITTEMPAICGKVMSRNDCQRPAPSMCAASYRSRSMLCNAARHEIIMKGKLRQILIMITEKIAHRSEPRKKM